MAPRTVSTTHFLVYRYILAGERTVLEIQEEFDLTRERALSVLRKLENHSFLYRSRTEQRKNGIVYKANPPEVGAACILTSGGGTILPR